MKHHIFRVVSALLACVLLLACFGSGYAAEASTNLDPQTASTKHSLSADSLAVKSIALNDAQGQELNKLCDEHQQSQQAKPQSNTASVKKRDWSKYTSHSAAISRLNSAEREFYKRLDSAARAYIEQPDRYVYRDTVYFIDVNISYADLGLSSDKIGSIYYWFRINNPQYYFLWNTYTYDSTTMHIAVMPFVKQLGNEAKVTNEMFDKLDQWIANCSKSGQTAWDKVVAIEKTICENTKSSCAASGDKNQTIYSVLMTSGTGCAGYASIFTAMANALGVDTVSVDGSARGAGHQWNIAQFDDGNYYLVDICWDDMGGSKICSYSYVGRGKDDSPHQNGKLVSLYAPATSSTSYCGFGRLDFGDGTVYTGEWKAGKMEGYGREERTDGYCFDGFCKDNLSEGLGVHTWDGKEYVLERIRNSCDGDGIIYYPDGTMTAGYWTRNWEIPDTYYETDTLQSSSGSIYRGTVKDGKPNCYGKATYTDGSVYIGKWSNGTPNGTGKFTWPDGSYYFGAWDNGDRTGQGIFWWSNGNVYVGSFLKTKLDGQGKFIWANGNVYQGAWKNDQQNGYGVMRYNSGCFYMGEWKNGQRDGQGKYTWPSGQVYEGGWKNGKYDGYGTMTAADGTQKSGQWKNGQFVDGPDNNTTDPDDSNTTNTGNTTDETLTWEYQNGTYSGQIKNRLRNGYGRMELNDGSSYEGEWKDGVMTGKGKYTWADGKVYEGEFKNGKGDGYGTLTYPDGTKKSGQWKNGKFVG